MQDWTQDPQQLELFQKLAQAAGVNRRSFLKLLAGASAAVTIAACASFW